MSRSYKKHPVYKDGSGNRRRVGKRTSKRMASKKVRRSGLAFRKSSLYKKISESWDICDYRIFMPLSGEMKEDREEMDWWKKGFFRK